MIIPNNCKKTKAITVTYIDGQNNHCRRDQMVAYVTRLVDIVAWRLDEDEPENSFEVTPWPIVATTFYSDVYILHPDGRVESQHDSMYNSKSELQYDLDCTISSNAKRRATEEECCNLGQSDMKWRDLKEICKGAGLDVPQNKLSMLGKLVKAWYIETFDEGPKADTRFINGEKRPVAIYPPEDWDTIAGIVRKYLENHGHAAPGYPNEHAVY